MIREAAGSIVMGYKAIATGSCVRYKVSNPGEKNVLESVMCCMKSVMDSVFPVVEDVHGFMCEIFFPVTNDSVYGYTTDQVTYHDEPDLIRRCAISGLMVDRNDSGDALDNFFGPQPIVWVSGDVTVVHHSKLRVLMGNSNYLVYLVDQEDSIYCMDDVLVSKLSVIPMAAR